MLIVASILGILASGLGLWFAYYTTNSILKEEPGTEKMQEIAKAIQEGAEEFIAREYRYVAGAVLIVTVLLVLLALLFDGMSVLTAIAYLLGAVASGAAGYVGMWVAVRANVRTTNAARRGLAPALRISFSSGVVMGIAVVSLALMGICTLFLFFGKDDIESLAGFGFGATSIAIFSRVGGGIFTKAADVGADLVGKVEKNIPEDDPRNPAVIADNVGDNVGDVAGMGADLFESYASSIIAALSLAVLTSSREDERIAFPLLVAVFGLLISLAATFLVRVEGGSTAGRLKLMAAVVQKAMPKSAEIMVDTNTPPATAPSEATLEEDANFKTVLDMPAAPPVEPTPVVETAVLSSGELLKILRSGVWTATGAILIVTLVLSLLLGLGLGVFIATAAGLIAGTLVGFSTEYYTSAHYRPTKDLAHSTKSGAGVTLIHGLSLGMESTVFPAMVVAVTALVAFHATGSLDFTLFDNSEFVKGLYGIAIAAVGMLATLGITLATDAYGPVADNAGGIAEMANLPPEVRQRTDALDSLGNTTAASGKGFAIASAAMTALALSASFALTAELNYFVASALDPRYITGLLIGAMLPFFFSHRAMNAVGKAAHEMVVEVRRQFHEIPGLLEGKEGVKPDYARCIDISTDSALKQMVVPGAVAVAVPFLIAIISKVGEDSFINDYIAAPTLLGVLAGSLAAAFMMALMMANAGGAWDNAKKAIEAGLVEGESKGSEAHKSAVVGDTVGDPFKDTAGPALNILLKLLAIVSLVLAPLLAG